MKEIGIDIENLNIEEVIKLSSRDEIETSLL